MSARRKQRGRQTSIEGTIARVMGYHDDRGWFSARVTTRHGEINVVGVVPIKPVAGMGITAHGSQRTHPVHGEQLHAEKLRIGPPTTEAGRRMYVKSLGLPVEPEDAALIAAFTGDHSKELIPELDPQLAEVVRSAWAESIALFELFAFLTQHGVRADVARRSAIQLSIMSPNPVADIKARPFILMDVGGTFADAEELRRALRAPTESPERYAHGIVAAVDEHCEAFGDTIISKTDAISCSARLLHESAQRVEPYIARATSDGTLVAIEDYLQRKWLAYAERSIATEIARLLKTRPRRRIPTDAEITDAFGFRPSGQQFEAVRSAFSEPITIITGPAGSGKTAIVRAIAKLAGKAVLAAPTGMAAKRLSELVGMPAGTLHHTLGGQMEGARWVFAEGRFSISGGIVAYDEFSEADTEVSAAAFRAVPSGTPLIIIGDINQLDSVGPGRVLADLIAAGIRTITLEVIFRHAGITSIPLLGKQILSGEMPSLANTGAIRFIPIATHRRPVEVLGIVRGMIQAGISQSNIRVLSPMWEGGCGINRLNQMLQAQWNPRASQDDGAHVRAHEDDSGHFEERFFVGDPILLTSNDHERKIYNGEILRVVAQRNRGKLPWLKVRTDDGRLFELEGQGDLFPFVLAYANTIHRAQGGEAPHVILSLLRTHRRMLTRRLLYTAVTRAKTSLTIVGELGAVRMAVNDEGEQRPRRTGLQRALRAVLGSEGEAAAASVG